MDIRIEGSISSGDTIAAFLQARALHRPSGRKVAFPGAMLVRFRGEQIVEACHCWDFLALVEQIGMVPPGRMDDLLPALMGA